MSEIPDFQWQASYSVGNELLDSQHKVLFELCQKIHQLDKRDEHAATEQYHDLLNEVSRYVRTHFHYEQYLLEKNNYEDLASHIVEHDALLTRFSTILVKARGLEGSEELAAFVADWLRNHILGTDMQYSHIFKKA